MVTSSFVFPEFTSHSVSFFSRIVELNKLVCSPCRPRWDSNPLRRSKIDSTLLCSSPAISVFSSSGKLRDIIRLLGDKELQWANVGSFGYATRSLSVKRRAQLRRIIRLVELSSVGHATEDSSSDGGSSVILSSFYISH